MCLSCGTPVGTPCDAFCPVKSLTADQAHAYCLLEQLLNPLGWHLFLSSDEGGMVSLCLSDDPHFSGAGTFPFEE
jgi:hypothetical protein